MTISSPSEFIKAQVDKPTSESKKWKMTILGLQGIAGFFAVGALMFIFKSSIADKVTTLTQIAITAWGGIVGIYLGAQGTVEYKATAALETLNKNENVHETEEITDNRRPKDFDDGSI
jgi:hypothetical protein